MYTHTIPFANSYLEFALEIGKLLSTLLMPLSRTGTTIISPRKMSEVKDKL